MNKQHSPLRYLAGLALVALIVVWFLIFYPIDKQLAKQEQTRQQVEQTTELVVHGKKITFAWLGKCVGVTDGDTLVVLDQGNKQVKTRLESINAPKLKQAFGEASKQALSSVVLEKMVSVHDESISVLETIKDRYGRTLAFLVTNGVDFNLAFIHDGFAWRFREYSRDESLADAETEARENSRGLWADPEPVEPWELRK